MFWGVGIICRLCLENYWDRGIDCHGVSKCFRNSSPEIFSKLCF